MNYIYFHNASPYPLMVDTWINLTMESRLLQPNSIYLLESSTTEWRINTMFENKKNREIWEETGYGSLTQLGMFSCVPCIKGKHVWMEHDDPFDCVYSKIEDDEKTDGLVTFFIRRDKKKKHIKLE